MKILLCGPAMSGKSTIARYIGKKYGMMVYESPTRIMLEKLKEIGLSLSDIRDNEVATVLWQYVTMREYLIDLLESDRDVVATRSWIDFMCYVKMFILDKFYEFMEIFNDEITELKKDSVSIYVEPGPIIEDDGIRDLRFVVEERKLFDEWAKKLCVDVIPWKMNIDKRFEIVDKVVEKWMKR